MNFILFLPRYLFWHYGRALKNYINIWINFIWFTYNFFSISLLLRTLFSRWKRMGEDYSKGFNLSKVFSTFVINFLMRIVGFIIRFTTIIIGLISVLVVFFVGFFGFFGWLVLPAVLIFLLVFGLGRILK